MTNRLFSEDDHCGKAGADVVTRNVMEGPVRRASLVRVTAYNVIELMRLIVSVCSFGLLLALFLVAMLMVRP